MLRDAQHAHSRLQGFSVDWWKSKHNTHHAAPNELADDGARVVDPDIDTLPLLVTPPTPRIPPCQVADAPTNECLCMSLSPLFAPMVQLQFRCAICLVVAGYMADAERCRAAWQAWSADMLESAKGAGTRMLLRAQHYFFFPILLFARLSWCQQGVAHAIDMTKVRSVRRGAHPG